MFADSYRGAGQPRAALQEYERLSGRVENVDGGSELYAVTVSAAAELLDELDRGSLAAERWDRAARAATAIGDTYHVAIFRCAESSSLLRSGDVNAAMSALSTAEDAVGSAEPPTPAARVYLEAQLERSAARILAAAGLIGKAAGRAASSAAAFRESEQPPLALEMDLLHGKLLLANGRPDLAEPVLRAAFAAAPEELRDPIALALTEALDRLYPGGCDVALRTRDRPTPQPPGRSGGV